jgi:drug/metabolite transporter (DMT)-like permease
VTLAPAPLGGIFLALASATFFGGNIVFARLASFAGVTGSTVVFWRVVILLALAGAMAAVLRQRLSIVAAERLPLLVLALATTIVGAAYNSSVAYVPVTVAVVILYLFPILIVLASPLVEGTPLTAATLGLAGLAFVGVVLVVGPVFAGLDGRGLALAALASVAASVQFFAAARCRASGTLAKVVWIHLIVLPVTALIGLLAGQLAGPAMLMLAPMAVALTIAGYVIGIILQVAALARSSAVVAGIAFCAEPVIATLTSAWVLGEGNAGLQWIGGGLVLAAIVLNIMAEQAKVRAIAPDPVSERADAA